MKSRIVSIISSVNLNMTDTGCTNGTLHFLCPNTPDFDHDFTHTYNKFSDTIPPTGTGGIGIS